MGDKRLLKHLVFLMFFIFIANTLALKLYWYYSIWYFDMPMHFLGGFWLALFFIYISSRQSSLKLSITQILILAMIFGILWELFEYYVFNVIGGIKLVKLDVVSDLFFDLAGGIGAILYYRDKIMNKESNRV